MHLPTDITIIEMQQLLHQLRTEYLPGKDASFIDQLDEEGLRFIFDILGEKDAQKREEMRKVLQQEMNSLSEEMKQIVHKADHIILQYREERDNEQNTKDIGLIEQELDAAF
ncbi:MAG: hypothetical protein LBG59_01655 [Candidatus Peribacteria bacterium]|jgi:hypothetical protein|nr:hypothetical protein [Candidatus Peribacteria bacterium]